MPSAFQISNGILFRLKEQQLGTEIRKGGVGGSRGMASGFNWHSLYGNKIGECKKKGYECPESKGCTG